jgi:hypothetical protein
MGPVNLGEATGYAFIGWWPLGLGGLLQEALSMA